MVWGRGLRGTETAPQQKNNPLREGQPTHGTDQQVEARNNRNPCHSISVTPLVEGWKGAGELCFAQVKCSQIFLLDATVMKTTHLLQRF